MQPPFIGRGHGKLILAGEHAVVYGYPALAVAIDRGVAACITPIDGPTRAGPGTPCDTRLSAALVAALGPRGFHVQLTSDLPLGRGMGSSAAIGVALVRARAAAEGRALSLDEVYERAFAIERIFHGTPSGLDHAVSSRGGLLRYRKGPPPAFETMPCPDLTLVVLDSGTAGNTKEMVDRVRRERGRLAGVLAEIGGLVEEVERALHDPERLGPLLTQNHRLLRRLGVSTPRLDELVELALTRGALGAKLAGAGGGGVVLALAPDADGLVRAAAAAGVAAFICRPAPTCEGP